MLCDFCKRREAVVHRFRVLEGFASLCEPCFRYSIDPQKHLSSEGDFCLVTDAKIDNFQQSNQPQKSAGIGDDDARPIEEPNDMTDSNKTTKRTSKSTTKPDGGNLPGIENEVPAADNAPPNKPPADVSVAATPEPPDRPQTADPFDPASLRINPNTASGAIGVKRKLVTLKVGKPDKMEFCRVHPSEEYRIDTAIVEDKANRESYLVAPALWPELPDFITLVRLCVAVNRHGTTFLWPAKLPDPNGRPMDWHTSMLEAQELATKSWVRVQADMTAGSYAVFEATGNLPDPEWPELSMGDLLKLAFKTRFIDSMNHPFLLELFGAA